MRLSAKVHSLAAIRRFQATVIGFREDATAALELLRQEANRVLDWIDHDRPAFWRLETQRWFDNVGHSRSAFSRKQMFADGGLGPSSIDERLALKKAKQRLETTVAKQATVRQWQFKLHRATDEFTSRIGRLDQALHRDVPHLLAQLERIITALEAYVTTPAPAGLSNAAMPNAGDSSSDLSPPAGASR